VLLKGHTGFKGSWLALWLLELGAQVTGLALPPETEPSLCAQLELDQRLDHRARRQLDRRDRATT
jgi:CDP-glucose 4,6-dehydratase